MCSKWRWATQCDRSQTGLSRAGVARLGFTSEAVFKVYGFFGWTPMGQVANDRQG